jgi:hypothetical protein
MKVLLMSNQSPTPDEHEHSEHKLDVTMLLLLPVLGHSPAWYLNPRQCWVDGDRTTNSPTHICMEIPNITDPEFAEHLLIITKHPLYESMIRDEDVLKFTFPKQYLQDFLHVMANNPSLASQDYQDVVRYAFRHFPNVLATFDTLFEP